jgi:cell division protein FtsI (penicillin-binding protein 3)
LATSVKLHEVILSPIHIPEQFIDLVSALLAEHLHLDAAETKDRILKKRAKKSQYLVIAKEVTPLSYKNLQRALKKIYSEGDRDFRKAFRDIRARGISQDQNTYRYYTGKSDAAPLLGGFSQYSHRGVGGLEQQYDSVLRGAEFATIRIRDGQNQDVIQITPEEMAPQAQDGKNVVLTLDRRIQHITDEAIAKAVETAKAKSGFAVVVDIKTGEILASSTQPTANINDNSVFQNGMLTHHGLVDSYEAGSVLKPLVVASALNEGLYSPDTLIDCNNGYWRIHGASIRDDHPKSILSVTEVIQYSSNIGAAKVALELGKENTIDYLRKFGLGQETGLGFPAEPRGILRNASRVKPIELITMSYGYGLTTTLTQLAMAYAALGNDGVLMKPLLVKEITDANGEVMERFEPSELQQVVSPNVAQQMLTMMEAVVKDGTAKRAQVAGYRVAGKTGTAKKAALGGYSDTDRIGSFVGLIPADNPRLAIAISIDTPTEGLAYGGVVAAPAFSEIAGESMRVLGIQPTEEIQETSKDHDTKMQFVEAAAPPEIIWTEKGEIIVPNLTGLTLRDALSTLQIANLNLRFKGSGRVV